MEDLVEKLDRLGFSSNEIKILLFLYSNGQPQQADDISEATGVALTRAYESLDILTQKEFITVIQGRPRKYRVLPPTESLSLYVEQERKKLEDQLQMTQNMVNETLELAQSLYLSNHTQIQADELMVQFKSLADAEEQTIRIIEEAEDEVLIFTHVFYWFNKIENAILRALERGCKVRVLMQPEIEPAKSLDEVDHITIEYLQELGIEVKPLSSNEIMTRGTIVDRKHVVFVIWVDQPRVKEQPRIFRPQFSSNTGIVDVFYGYFEYLFHSA
ncbi:MAG: TrmB family transcriptional regulator [Candidatus Kariarchaeaceae archaeon]